VAKAEGGGRRNDGETWVVAPVVIAAPLRRACSIARRPPAAPPSTAHLSALSAALISLALRQLKPAARWVKRMARGRTIAQRVWAHQKKKKKNVHSHQYLSGAHLKG